METYLVYAIIYNCILKDYQKRKTLLSHKKQFNYGILCYGGTQPHSIFIKFMMHFWDDEEPFLLELFLIDVLKKLVIS
jgi:hypothetical protein